MNEDYLRSLKSHGKRTGKARPSTPMQIRERNEKGAQSLKLIRKFSAMDQEPLRGDPKRKRLTSVLRKRIEMVPPDGRTQSPPTKYGSALEPSFDDVYGKRNAGFEHIKILEHVELRMPDVSSIPPSVTRAPARDLGPSALASTRRRVVDRPDDVAARAAFARAASNAGQRDRAQLVEAQLRIAAGNARSGDATRVRSSLAEHGATWARDELGDDLVDRVSGVWRRGFIELVELDGETFTEHARELLRRVPVRAVVITSLEGVTLAELLKTRELGRLRALALSGLDLDDDDARLIARAPVISKLRWLDLSHNRIGDDGVRALVASEHLRELAWVDLDGNPSRLVPRLGGVDHGRVMDISRPEELLEGAPRWLLRDPGTEIPWWVEG